MALRDLPYTSLASVFVLTGLSPAVLDAIPAALTEVVRVRSAARRRWPGSVLTPRLLRTARLDRAVARSVRRVREEADDAGLVLAATADGFAGIPVTVLLTPTRCVVATAHAVFDGTGSVQLIEDLLLAATGGILAPEPPAVRFPLVRALRDVRPAELLRSGRMLTRRAAERILVRGPSGREEVDLRTARPDRGAASAALRLDAEDLQAVRRYTVPGSRGRSTLNGRLGSLMLTALQQVHVGARDPSVVVTVDLRHRVPGRIAGNFVFAGRIGRLLDDWTPHAFAARVLPLLDTRALLALLTEWLRVPLDRVLRSGAVPSSLLYVSLLQGSEPADPAAGPATVTVASFGPHSAATFACGWIRGTTAYVSVWDESGDFELERFPSRLRGLLRSTTT